MLQTTRKKRIYLTCGEITPIHLDVYEDRTIEIATLYCDGTKDDSISLGQTQTRVLYEALALMYSPDKEIAGEPQGKVHPAIIERVSYGLRDIGKPCLWFLTMWGCFSSLQVFVGDDSIDFLKKNAIQNIADLEGRRCIVWEKDNGNVEFLCLL